MKINSKIKKLQEGGATPTPADQGVAAPAGQPTGAPAGNGAPDAGADPIMQLAQMAQQALQTGDGQMALAVCEGFLQLISQMAGEAGAAPAPQGEPVFKKGGKIVKRI